MADEDGRNIDLSLSTEEMLRIRDRVRQSLVTEFHEVNILLRARRKVGDAYTVRRLDLELRRIVLMIHALENPME
jgi:hypothetical protein